MHLSFTKHSSSYFKSLLLRQEDNLFNSVLCSCIIVSDEHYPCTPSFRRYFTIFCIRRCICGAASGIIFRFASSTGGFDVVGLIVAKYRDVSIGAIIFVFNLILLVVAGFIFGWDITLYTLISRFVVSKVIDAVHTKHIKLTIMTITEKGEEIKSALLHHGIRGVTMVDAVGGYTNHKKK